jgi:signal transduction histidine kinase
MPKKGNNAMKNEKAINAGLFNILIVDDIGTNLKLLDDILIPEGYKTRLVPGGELALIAAKKEKPDLILLDIMMPGMDGFEVCRRLKETPDLACIPVIFISALGDTDNIVNAFSVGGVDYINKPFQAEEVKARVRTHLKMHQQSVELLELNATKDKFFSIIAHDLRGPLGAFLNLTKLINYDSRKLTDDKKKDIILALNKSAQNTYDLVQNLLEWSQMVRGNIAFDPHNLGLKDIITDCVNLVSVSAREKSINLIMEVSDEYQVFADSNMLQTIIRNLLSNSIKYTHNEGKVIVSAEPAENNMIFIMVKDTGIGMNIQMVENLFRIDVNTNRPGTNKESSTGLGLLLCKEFAEKQGGEIGVESVENQGSVFHFTIPCYLPG